MSMVMLLAALDDEEVASLEAHPGSIPDFTIAAEGHDPEATRARAEAAMAPGPAGWLLRRLSGMLMRPADAGAEAGQDTADAAPGLWQPPPAGADPRPLLDLDGDWHALHWLLTGTTADGTLPAGLLFGGRAIGEDLGYGPLRVLAPGQVAEAAAHLESLDRDALLARADADAMEMSEIHPGGFGRDDGWQDALARRAEDLKAFLRARAEAGDYVAIWLS